ncbi:PKD domain-containing protein [Aquimarina sp. AU474]|uniref:PKD domain-containing protein n=1 Tax=Aquimarina sp. AU474 TaxID=2108529 RepID=UPI000D68980C|nr:PKD domain-containing protein [Aquimarina sp. AU474]
MITKLAKISPGFRRFSKSQFLTESHLNQIVDHFDDQIRLSRINLSGVGIVCGFDIKSTARTITITQGLGITTDGDLLHLYRDRGENKIIDFPEITYTHFRVYDNEKANYTPFFYQGDDQIELYELLPRREDSETFPLTQLSAGDGPDLQDMVVLIYLEHFERNINRCSSLSCDGEGIDVVANFKILVTTKANAAVINSHDKTISRPNFKTIYYQLPEVFLPKVIPGTDDFKTLFTLWERLSAPFGNKKIIEDVKEGFVKILDTVKAPELKLRFENRINELFDFDTDNALQDIQYRYDLLKDVVDTYNEIKRVLLQLSSTVCTANLGDFPKHLMLGEVFKEKACYDCRHSFYKSLAHTSKSGDRCNNCNNDDSATELSVCYDIHNLEQKMYSLLLRVIAQLENYNFEYKLIKITPSLIRGTLGNKAIPFYNKVDKTLLKLWNFDKSVRHREGTNISYHTNLLDNKIPLDLCIDKNFYRIEGHQGKNYKAVIEKLKEIKSKKALSFNIVALGVTSREIITGENYTSYYLNRRQGIEHKAGVSPRGTFILVFLEDAPRIIGEGESFRREVRVSEFAEGVFQPVIADFMVPYLCCDESVLTLELPMDTLCFGRDTEPIPFKTNPRDGFVTADIPAGLSGGVVRDDNGDSFFDPNQVSPELIGAPIKFEVNNQDSEVTITIHRKPEPIITTSVVYDNPFKTEVTVTYTVSGPHIDEITRYEWDFGDGTIIEMEPDAAGVIVRQYDNLPETAPNTINPVLRVNTDFCENTIIIDPITFEDPIVIELELDRNEICVNPEDCDIPVHIALLIDESGSISGNEITEIKNGLTVFVNDQENSGNLITLCNMNVNDNLLPTRIIPETAITPTTKSQFTNWISEYKTDNSTLISADYWSSAIGYLTNDISSPNPLTVDLDIVIIITDGLQTQNFTQLKDRVARLSNQTHIFYYALSDGSYASSSSSRDLAVALPDLLGRPPVLSNPDFSDIDTADYSSFTNFGQLGQFLSNLKTVLDNAIGCVEKINAITLQPPGGQITTLGTASFNGLQIQGTVITINPQEFDAYGQVITFAVDGFDTGTTLVVGRAPEFAITVDPDKIEYNDDKTKAIVTFDVTGEYIPEPFALKWDFGDGSPVFEGTELIQKHEYTDIAALGDRIAIVNLTVEDPACGPVTETARVVFEEIEEEVSLTIAPRVCLDDSGEMDGDLPVPFVVTPAGGKVAAVRRANGMRIGTNQLTLSSGFTRFDEPIEFTVNDKPVPDTLTVVKKPIFSARFNRFAEEGMIITEGPIIDGPQPNAFPIIFSFFAENLSSIDDKDYKFIWDFGDGSSFEAREVAHRYRVKNVRIKVTVTLTIEGGLCDIEPMIIEIDQVFLG